ncbi:MAG: AtpZ/AtpI family protein [Chloroflexi bacterium]|nr:MAG: AtpZ/AtpI family protein [Chloroflexota bacterium]
MLKMGLQVAVAIGFPLLVGTFGGNAIDMAFGSGPWGLLVGILVGLVVAGLALFGVLRRYLSQPIGPPSDRARAAGRRWESEIQERERQRESGEENEDR